MKKYIVEGQISRLERFCQKFDNVEEADKAAKMMATKYQKVNFYVRYPDGPNIVFGLTDHHYKWDSYFKDAVRFCHND